MGDFRPIVSKRHEIVEAPRAHVHKHVRIGLIQSHEERIVQISKDHHGEDLSSMSVSREHQPNILPHNGLHSCPRLVGQYHGWNALLPPGQCCMEIHAVRAIARRKYRNQDAVTMARNGNVLESYGGKGSL